MTTVDVDALLAAAQNATPGPWEVEDERGKTFRDGPSRSLLVCPSNKDLGIIADVDLEGLNENADNDAAFIAAASPDVVTALCQRVKRAEANAERNGTHWCRCSRADRQNDKAHPDCPLHGTPMNQQRDEARAALTALRADLKDAEEKIFARNPGEPT